MRLQIFCSDFGWFGRAHGSFGEKAGTRTRLSPITSAGNPASHGGRGAEVHSFAGPILHFRAELELCAPPSLTGRRFRRFFCLAFVLDKSRVSLKTAL